MSNHYTRTLDLLNVDRPKCKCCGNDIIYENTEARTYTGELKILGKSYRTIKIIDGVEYTLKVCEKCLLKHFPDIKNLSRIFNVMCEATKFAFEIPDEVYNSKRANYAMTKEKMITKYGETNGLIRWENYCKKQSETNTFEYKQKMYGWTEKQFKEYNKSRAVTLNNLIKKHGKEEGTKLWNNYVEQQIITKSWDYMVKTYGIKKAREINKSKSLTLENFIKKYGEEKGKNKWLDYSINRNNGVSKISQQLFKNLDKHLSKKYTTYYYSKNNEYFVHGIDQIYYLDYYIKELNICIEYNGGCFHGDSRIYEDDEYCNPFDKTKTAKEIRDKDKLRYKYLQDKYGIKTYVIWELDYNPDNFDYIKYITETLKITL